MIYVGTPTLFGRRSNELCAVAGMSFNTTARLKHDSMRGVAALRTSSTAVMRNPSAREVGLSRFKTVAAMRGGPPPVRTPLAFWNFDEAGSGDRLDSAAGLVLQNRNSTHPVLSGVGLIGKAADFASSSEAMFVTSSNPQPGVLTGFFDGTNAAATMALWLSGNDGVLFNGGNFFARFNGGQLELVMGSSTYPLNAGASGWWQLVWVLELSNAVATHSLFVNGSALPPVTTPALISGGGLSVGGGFFNGTGNLTFNGKMDSLGVFPGVLSNSEIATLYNSGFGQQYPFA